MRYFTLTRRKNEGGALEGSIDSITMSSLAKGAFLAINAGGLVLVPC